MIDWYFLIYPFGGAALTLLGLFIENKKQSEFSLYDILGISFILGLLFLVPILQVIHGTGSIGVESLNFYLGESFFIASILSLLFVLVSYLRKNKNKKG